MPVVPLARRTHLVGLGLVAGVLEGRQVGRRLRLGRHLALVLRGGLGSVQRGVVVLADVQVLAEREVGGRQLELLRLACQVLGTERLACGQSRGGTVSQGVCMPAVLHAILYFARLSFLIVNLNADILHGVFNVVIYADF